MAGQGEVEGIDNHGAREDGSVHITHCSVQVVLLREGISRSHLCSWGDLPDDVKILEEEGSSSLATREFVRIFEIGQVFMISENGDRM